MAANTQSAVPNHPSQYGKVLLPISAIRKDGGTQSRLCLNPQVVEEYAALMKYGVEFPAIRTWFDGRAYWLTDGFHRLAATEKLHRNEILGEVLQGTLLDALWDSCAANTTHGLRRSPEDTEEIIKRALAHKNGVVLSNNQVARHLGVPEATLRRWRKRLSSPDDEDSRLAVRGGSTYFINTGPIGKHSTPQAASIPAKPKLKLEQSLSEMKTQASPEARRLLNILANWLLGSASDSASLLAIERLIGEWRRQIK